MNTKRSNYSSYHHGIPPTPPVQLLYPHKHSTTYHTHPRRKHHHLHIHSDKKNSYGIQQVLPVNKECRISYGVLGMDKIHPQDRKIGRTNNEDTPKTIKKTEDKI